MLVINLCFTLFHFFMYQFDGVMVSLNLGIDTNRQEVLGEKPF